MKEVVIVSAVRTPIGKFGGMLSSLSAPELGSIVIKEVLRRAGLQGSDVSEVLMGCVCQAGLGQNVARQASLKAGVPEYVPATTINTVCGSSLKCVNLAASMILSGLADVIVAGGMESMSNAPYVLDKARFGYRMNNGVLKDTLISDALWDSFNDYHMGVTAENIAKEYGISRQEQDMFAVESQNKCEAARKTGKFADEIVPVSITQKKQIIVVSEDEFPRDGVTLDSISGLKPAFAEDGTVTAANASGINDGAACVILMSREKADDLGIKPLAIWICGSNVGVATHIMGVGAGYAAKSVMEKAELSLDDLTLIEANEAFASQSIASARIAGWDKCMDKVNVNGGAIALGHPVGASGARILTTLIYELKRRNGGYGLATLCVGGGMGVSTIIKI